MSQGGYSHTTRATGTVLTAAIYNADHQNHVTNQNPAMTGGYSDTLAQMQLTTDPGSLGTESLASTLAGEIERIRHQLSLITGEPQWYVAPGSNLKQVGGTVADGSVPLIKLNNTTQGKIMGRTSAGIGPWQEFDIPGLADLVPAQSDFVLGSPAAGGAPRRIAVSSIISPPAATNPQGRLTLVANTPVVLSAAVGATTIYYTPYIGVNLPVWNGSVVIGVNTGGQLSQAMTDATKSPGVALADRVYDIFFWMDGTTPRISRGPPWASVSSRGVGANTSELTRISGLLVNAVAITNGPAANRGTYLGSIYSTTSLTCDWRVGSINNQPAFFGVYNYYNRIWHSVAIQEAAATWSGTGAGPRMMNNNANNRVYALQGMQEDQLEFGVAFRASCPQNLAANCWINAPDLATGSTDLGGKGNIEAGSNSGVVGSVQQTYKYNPGLGYHFYQAMENNSSGVTLSGVGFAYTRMSGYF